MVPQKIVTMMHKLDAAHHGAYAQVLPEVAAEHRGLGSFEVHCAVLRFQLLHANRTSNTSLARNFCIRRQSVIWLATVDIIRSSSRSNLRLMNVRCQMFCAAMAS